MLKNGKESAREKFRVAGKESHKKALQNLEKARENMNENLHRIALWLPQMIDDEIALRQLGSELDTGKLKQGYFGG